MARSYRTRSKRILMRSGNGQFRKSALSDFGIGTCCKCQKVFRISVEHFDDMDFPDPREMQFYKTHCPTCGDYDETKPKEQEPFDIDKFFKTHE